MTDAVVHVWLDVSHNWADLFLLWSWRSLLLLGLTWAIVRLDRSNAAALRCQIWLAGMITVAVLPLCGALVMQLPVQQPAVESLTYLTNLPEAIRIASGDSVQVPALSATPATRESMGTPAIAIASLVRGVLFVAWAAGLAWCMVRLGYSCWRMHHLRSRARKAVLLSGSSQVTIGYSSEVSSPILAGILHPMILLPSEISEWTTEEERRAIVLHEIAHFERGDQYLNLFQRLLGAVFFFHPMVRYASRQLSLERELACDECVLHAGADSAAYAEAILKVAEHDIQQRENPQPAFNSSRKILERRMDMIFNGRRPLLPSTGRRFTILAKALLMVGAMTWLLLPQRELTASVAPEPVLVAEVQEPAQPPAPVVKVAQVAPPIVVPPLAVTLPAPQQSLSGSITGKVLDASGALIPGVKVEVTTNSLTTPIVAITNASGAFAFPQLPADSYVLTASTPGFRTLRLTNIPLQAGATQQQNLTLQVASVSTTVEVTTRRTQPTPPVNTPVAGGSPPPSPPQRIGGDVAQANLIFAPKPQYPATMRNAGIQDYVMIQAVIGKDGVVLNPTVLNVNVHPDLAKAALDAVQQWRYKPSTLNGQPIDVVTTITVNFSLTD